MIFTEVKGMLTTCDRCGVTCFRKCVVEGETDGGFTRWNKFEPYPDGWDYHSETGRLCPECNGEYIKFLNEFLGQERAEVKGG